MNKQTEISRLVEGGKTTSEISKELGIPIATVRYYREAKRKSNQLSRIAEHRKRLKRKAIDYSGGKCLHCGYCRCAGAMDFHHLDPAQKESKLASGKTQGWDRFKRELDKTILLCATCHREIHEEVWSITDDIITLQQQLRDLYKDRSLVEYAGVVNLVDTQA